ncbi:MAG: hypothetical protein U0796_06815 [Gemmatales bacterium]
MSTTSSRSRLSNYSRFLLALVLGIAAWLGVGWLLEPRPLWSLPFPTSHEASVPVALDQVNQRLAIQQLRLGRLPEMAITGLAILDPRSGKTIKQNHMQVEEMSTGHFFFLRFAMPKLVGDILWRLRAVNESDATRYELRAWPFTTDQPEQVIKTWKGPKGMHFQVAFTSDTQPYLITQTTMPWELLLPAIGADAWTTTLAATAFSRQSSTPDDEQIIIMNTFSGQFFKKGLLLPQVQTWELPAKLSDPLKLLASWSLPPLRTSWPPACASDLSWVAFGDELTSQEWNVGKGQVSLPRGTQLYDGRRGVLLPIKRQTVTDAYHIDGLDDVLLMTPLSLVTVPLNPETQQEKGATGQQLLDAKTALPLAWPWGRDDTVTISKMLRFPNHAHRYLALEGIAGDSWSPNLFGHTSKSTLHHLERTAAGFTIMKSVKLVVQKHQQFISLHHLTDREIGIHAIIDPVPTFLREQAEKWPWLHNLLEKTWPRAVNPSLLLFDVETGQLLREMKQNFMSGIFEQSNGLAFSIRSVGEHDGQNQPRYLGLDAWELPLMSHGWSPWWSRGLGLALFVLLMAWRRRR